MKLISADVQQRAQITRQAKGTRLSPVPSPRNECAQFVSLSQSQWTCLRVLLHHLDPAWYFISPLQCPLPGTPQKNGHHATSLFLAFPLHNGNRTARFGGVTRLSVLVWYDHGACFQFRLCRMHSSEHFCACLSGTVSMDVSWTYTYKWNSLGYRLRVYSAGTDTSNLQFSQQRVKGLQAPRSVRLLPCVVFVAVTRMWWAQLLPLRSVSAIAGGRGGFSTIPTSCVVKSFLPAHRLLVCFVLTDL